MLPFENRCRRTSCAGSADEGSSGAAPPPSIRSSAATPSRYANENRPAPRRRQRTLGDADLTGCQAVTWAPLTQYMSGRVLKADSIGLDVRGRCPTGGAARDPSSRPARMSIPPFGHRQLTCSVSEGQRTAREGSLRWRHASPPAQVGSGLTAARERRAASAGVRSLARRRRVALALALASRSRASRAPRRRRRAPHAIERFEPPREISAVGIAPRFFHAGELYSPTKRSARWQSRRRTAGAASPIDSARGGDRCCAR